MGLTTTLFADMARAPEVALCRQYSGSGGRTWWAHFEFTHINTTPIILPKKIEDPIEILESARFRGRVPSGIG